MCAERLVGAADGSPLNCLPADDTGAVLPTEQTERIGYPTQHKRRRGILAARDLKLFEPFGRAKHEQQITTILYVRLDIGRPLSYRLTKLVASSVPSIPMLIRETERNVRLRQRRIESNRTFRRRGELVSDIGRESRRRNWRRDESPLETGRHSASHSLLSDG